MYAIIVILVFLILYLLEKYEKFGLNDLLDNFIQAIPIFGFDNTKNTIKKKVKEDLKKTIQQVEGIIGDDKTKKINNFLGIFPDIDTGVTKDTDEKYCQIKYYDVFSVKENSNNKYVPNGKYVLF
jgi:hypothetical protein